MRSTISPQGFPPPIQTHLIVGAEEQGGSRTSTWRKEPSQSARVSGEARPASRALYSHLVLCKIFIHSPKRLRLQVLGGGWDKASSGATLGTSTAQPGPAVLPAPGLGGGARAGVRLSLDSVGHRGHLSSREKQPRDVHSQRADMQATPWPVWPPGARQGGGGMWAPSRS